MNTNQKERTDHQDTKIAQRRVIPFGRSLTQSREDAKSHYEFLCDSAALRENQKSGQPLDNLRGQVLPSISSAEKNLIHRFRRLPQITEQKTTTNQTDEHESEEKK